MHKSLSNFFLRIDARALGLFRIAMGVVLIADLGARWRWITAFYSNLGVLPNHNHIFNLRETGHVWSLLHAFSSPDESRVAFAFILFFYACFLVGYKTRAFHVLSLIALVSLTGRNILLENAGNYVAIALLAFTLFLPTGSRLSVDALRRALARRDDKRDEDLNTPLPKLDDSLHPVGWSPISVAALAVLAQLVVIYVAMAVQQRGASWRDGSALYYALHVDRWVSPLGVQVRELSPALLSGLTRLLQGATFAVPVLLLVPVARRYTRLAAFALMAAYGLAFGLLFEFGMFGWALVAGSFLALSAEVFEASAARATRRRRALTVVYDADCGLCLAICRILQRLDAYGRLTFQGNTAIAGDGDPTELVQRDPSGELRTRPMPASITAALADSTVIVVDERDQVMTRGGAVRALIGALPFGAIAAFILGLPVLRQLLDLTYDLVARNRIAIGGLMGFGACGVPIAADEDEVAEATTASPARRSLFRFTGAVRDLLAAVALFAMLAQAGRANHIPLLDKLPQSGFLADVVAWPRMLARFDVLAPEPPRVNAMLVIDAQTRRGDSLDPLTGQRPKLDPAQWRGSSLGQLWGDYLTRIHDKEWAAFEQAFREYINRGGFRAEDTSVTADDRIAGFDAYLISVAIPPPGAAPTGEPSSEKLFSSARGGRSEMIAFPRDRQHFELPARPPARQP